MSGKFSKIKFGDNLTVTDEGEAVIRVDATGGGGAGGGHTIADEGAALAARPTLDFTGPGVTVTDDAANNKTRVTIPGANPAADVPAGGTAGQVLTKDTATDFDTSWQPVPGGSGLIAIKEDGVVAGTRGGINFHEAPPVTNTYASVKSTYATYATLKASSRVTIVLADDAANNEVDVTIGVT